MFCLNFQLIFDLLYQDITYFSLSHACLVSKIQLFTSDNDFMPVLKYCRILLVSSVIQSNITTVGQIIALHKNII